MKGNLKEETQGRKEKSNSNPASIQPSECEWRIGNRVSNRELSIEQPFEPQFKHLNHDRQRDQRGWNRCVERPKIQVCGILSMKLQCVKC